MQALRSQFQYRFFDLRHPLRNPFRNCAAVFFRYNPVSSVHGFDRPWAAATILYLKLDESFSGVAAEYAMPKSREPFNREIRSSQTGQGATTVELIGNEGFRYDTSTLPGTFGQSGADVPPKEDRAIKVTGNWRIAQSAVGDVTTTCGPRRAACPCVANFAR